MYINKFGAFNSKEIEVKYQSSDFSGLHLFPLLIIQLIFNQHYLIIFIIVSLILFVALHKQQLMKWNYLIRILLLILELKYYDQNQYCWFCLISNQIFIPQWQVQVLIQFLGIRTIYDFQLCILICLFSRFLEIKKRQLFKQSRLNVKKIRELNQIQNIIPQNVFIINENAQIIFTNNSITKFSEDYEKKLIEYIRKSKSRTIIITILQGYYLFQPYYKQFKLIQLQFSDQQGDIFKQLNQQTDQLYNQLCQDYQKWNNLRAFKSVKESDLSILAQCTSDCRMLKQQFESINFLVNDLQQKPIIFERIQFHIKNYVINLVESMISKLQDHFNLIQLEFESGIPDYLVSEKQRILFTLYSFLLSASISKQKQEKLKISVRVAQVDNDKSGYDLEFSLTFPCTPQQLQLYTNGECNNHNEELIYYQISKCKEFTNVEYKLADDNLIILFTINGKWQNQNQKDGENIMSDNIQLADLNFTKNQTNQNNYNWKAKIPTSPSIDFERIKSPLNRSTNKFFYCDSIQQSTIQIKSIPQSTIGTAPNSVFQSLENSTVNENQIEANIQQAIQYTIQFPEIRDDILSLIEDTLQTAYNEGVLDHDVINIDSNSNVQDDKVCSLSEYAESVPDGGSEANFNSPRQFITPQLKPRLLKQILADRKQQLRSINYKKKKEKSTIVGRNNKNQKQLSVLFSPCVMSKLQNNLVNICEKKYGKLPNISEEDYSKFNSKIRDQRKKKILKKWSHRIKVEQIPTMWPSILCYIPDSQFQNLAELFGKGNYGELTIGQPIVCQEVPELIKIYKEYFSIGRQFFFILIQIQKLIDIDELCNAVQINESQYTNNINFKPTVLIGATNNPQLNKTLYSYIKGTIQIGQDTKDLKVSKDWILKTLK